MKTFAGLKIGTYSTTIALLTSEDENGDGYEVICNEDGDRTIPSVIAYCGDDVLVGSTAAAQRIRNPVNTLSHFTWLIGKSFSDDAVSTLGRKEGMKFRSQENDYVEYHLIDNETGKERFVSPIDVFADYLQQMKKTAEGYSGNSIDGIVLTVPVSFPDEFVPKLKEASTKQGLVLINVIKDPVSVLHSFNVLSSSSLGHGDCVVIDCGHMHTTASVVSTNSGLPVIEKAETFPTFSGIEINEKLSSHFADEFMRKFKCDPREAKKSMMKLRQAVDQTKKTLSSSQNAYLIIESMHEGIDFNSSIHRMRFESLLNEKLLQEFKKGLLALKHGGLRSGSKIYLTGASSAIPKVGEVIDEIFQGFTVMKDQNPSDTAAQGAVIEAISVWQTQGRPDTIQSVISEKYDKEELTTCNIGLKTVTENGEECIFELVPFNHPLPLSRAVEIQPSNLTATQLVISLIDLADGNRELMDILIEDYQPESSDLCLRCEMSSEGDLRVYLNDVEFESIKQIGN